MGTALNSRDNPCKRWPECETLYGKQADTIPRVVPNAGVVITEATPRTFYGAPPVIPPPFPAVDTVPPTAPVQKKVKVVATISLYERIGKIESTLEAINADLAKGMLNKTLADEKELIAARSEVASLKAAAAKVAAMPKLPPEPPKPPKLGDRVWLKSSGKGPFVLVGEIATLEIDVIREKGSNLKSRYTVEGFTARWEGSGKAVALPKEDVTTTKPVFPTLVGRAVKYAFVVLGLTTLLTASLAFGRMAFDRAVHGPDRDVAPVTSHAGH